MPSLDKLATQPRVHRLIIYGPPGSGKTWSIGKLARTHKIIYFSLENGFQTLLNPACVAVEDRKNITIIQMRDTPENPIVSTSLDTFFKERKGSFCEKHGRINCAACKKAGEEFIDIDLDSLGADTILVFDSLTQWAESITFYLTRENPEAKADFEFYRKLGLYLGRSLSRIQLVDNCSIIVLSHETDTETVSGSDKIVPAGGTRNFARNNARYFDGAYYCYRENKKHKLASSSTFSNVVETKDRTAFDTSKFLDSGNALLALFNPSMADDILKSEQTPVKK